MTATGLRLSLVVLTLGLWLAGIAPRRAAGADAGPVEQWGLYEVKLDGPSAGNPSGAPFNPFTDVDLSADFTSGDRRLTVAGFYDGDGVYRVRFMPPAAGDWRYETRSNRPELSGKAGGFACVKPAAGPDQAKAAVNHGPVRVRNTFHFAYADGTPYFQVGTTCYAWTHQADALQEQTLATLKASPFNKLRLCVFPKWYDWNRVEPALYPFEGTAPNRWDFSRFNPKFFQHLEKRVGQLRDLGIEADLILFHPYDEGHWGFDRMSSASDDRYLRYVVARLAAYRNVWWSMANEFDFMKEKRDSDWDRFGEIVQKADPFDHLRSIHNGTRIYDHNKPWVTHASIQNGAAVADFGRAVLYRDAYRKPVVFDEVKYEGDIEKRWGNLSAEEMVRRFWHGTIDGTYVGHGETYKHPEDDVLWWAKGGVLRGQSPSRIAFLRKVLEDGPAEGLEPVDKWQDDHIAGKQGEYYLIYFGNERPLEWVFELPKAKLTAGMTFKVEVLDTWNMTVTPVAGVFKVKADAPYRFRADGPGQVRLPGKPYMALRIKRVEG